MKPATSKRLAVFSLIVASLAGCNADSRVSAVSDQPTSPAEKGGIDETGPYDVVTDWFKPLHAGKDHCVVSVYAESPTRIYVLAPVEVPSTQAPGPCSAENTPDAHRHSILILDGSGSVIDEWTQWNELLRSPHSVETNPYDPDKHVWIVDSVTSQVHKFSHDGKQLVMSLGMKDVPGEDETHFNRPTDIAFFSDGSFVVADGYGNSRIVRFDPNGKFMSSWGTRGSGPGQLNVPHSVAIDNQGRVFVADRDNQRIQVFDMNGKYLDEWPHVRGPVSLIVSADQHLGVLTGSASNRVLKYDLDGKLLTYWGTSNYEQRFPGSLYAAHGFSADSDGNLYVADYRNHRVQKFVPKKNADRSRLVQQPQ